MIAFDHVGKIIDGRRILDDISLTVPKGAFCIVVGSSGAGKSTLLKLVNRLVPLSSGTIRLDGVDIASLPVEALRRRIGYAIQSIGLFPHWTVEDNIATVPRLLDWPKPRIRARVEALMSLLQLDPAAYRGQYPHQLSGGQQQRVGIARALAADPDIVLMDEPFGALDPLTRETLRVELLAIQRQTGKTIVFVTHDIEMALITGDLLVILHEGKVAQAGAPRDLLDHPAGDFVRDFIGGAAIGLNRLALCTVMERMRPGAAAAATTIAATASLKDALAAMIAAQTGRLAVRDAAGRIVGSLDLADLVK